MGPVIPILYSDYIVHLYYLMSLNRVELMQVLVIDVVSKFGKIVLLILTVQ